MILDVLKNLPRDTRNRAPTEPSLIILIAHHLPSLCSSARIPAALWCGDRAYPNLLRSTAWGGTSGHPIQLAAKKGRSIPYLPTASPHTKPPLTTSLQEVFCPRDTGPICSSAQASIIGQANGSLITRRGCPQCLPHSHPPLTLSVPGKPRSESSNCK